MKVSEEKFKEIVYQKIENLPNQIKKRLENIEFFIEEENCNFLGFYQGVPFPKRKSCIYSLVLPDRIILFKNNIENQCKDEKELQNMIEKVLLHEIGHYLGLNEKQLKKLGL